MALFGAADAVRAVSPLCRNLIPSSLHNLLNVFLRDLESSNCKGSILIYIRPFHTCIALHFSTCTHNNTSAKIIRWQCRDDVALHRAKNRGAILSRILAQSCITLCLNYVGREKVGPPKGAW